MTYLSRLAKLGLAKEVTAATWLAPTISVPFSTAKYVNVIDPLRDESVRANDAVLQGLQQGVAYSTWEIESNSYADLIGHWLRAMIGPDTVAAGVSTTLASNSIAGATSLSLTATIPNNSIIQVSDAAGANTEWVQVGTVTGSGPYTAPVTSPAAGMKYAHTAAGGSVISQTTHTFKQNRSFATVWPTYSFTVDDGASQLGWPGCVCSEVGIKIDPKGLVTWAPKFTGFPSITEATFAYAASQVQPMQGWAWTVSNAGASSTRGLTMDITLKRAVEAINSSDGTQGPREVFPGAMEIDGAYKCVYENQTDYALFQNAVQLPTVHTLTQPAASGGASVAITMSQSGYHTGAVDLGSTYVQAAYDVSGVANTVDAGVTSVVLKNFLSSAFLRVRTANPVCLVGSRHTGMFSILSSHWHCSIVPPATDHQPALAAFALRCRLYREAEAPWATSSQ